MRHLGSFARLFVLLTAPSAVAAALIHALRQTKHAPVPLAMVTLSGVLLLSLLLVRHVVAGRLPLLPPTARPDTWQDAGFALLCLLLTIARVSSPSDAISPQVLLLASGAAAEEVVFRVWWPQGIRVVLAPYLGASDGATRRLMPMAMAQVSFALAHFPVYADAVSAMPLADLARLYAAGTTYCVVMYLSGFWGAVLAHAVVNVLVTRVAFPMTVGLGASLAISIAATVLLVLVARVSHAARRDCDRRALSSVALLVRDVAPLTQSEVDECCTALAVPRERHITLLARCSSS